MARFLRLETGMMQADFGKKCRIDQASISRFELGEAPPPEESLRRMAAVSGVPWHAVVNLIRFYTAIPSATERGAASGEPFHDLSIEQEVADAIDLSVSTYLIEDSEEEPDASVLALERREAEETVAALLGMPLAYSRPLLSLSIGASRSWAVAEQLSLASTRAASHKVEEALALAKMALYVARRVPGVAERARTEGSCLAYLANAQRVATEFAASEATFAKAWELWEAGAAAAWLPLAEWRMLDLEASLRREQQRFAEALSRLDRALAACDGSEVDTGRLLTNKANVLQQLGDHAGALGALAEASPAIEASRDPHLIFGLRFNTAANLCYLDRFAEAELLLPEVRKLATEQGQDLALIRVGWLNSKLAAGQGKKEEAIAGLQQVSRDFADRQLPYEAALSSLDLALIWLEGGRTSEVRRLVLAMAWIFEAKGIAREGLAALSLFCEVVRQEVATVELAKQVISEMERAERSAFHS